MLNKYRYINSGILFKIRDEQFDTGNNLFLNY